MTHRRTTAVLVAALCAASAPGIAGADAVPGPRGAPCSMAETAVATAAGRSGGNRAAMVQGGPLAGDGTLRCSIQVGQSAHGFSAAASVTATGETVVTLAPGTVSWAALPTDDVYLCTSFQVTGGPTLYWDADGAHWATAPAPCWLLGASPSAPDGDRVQVTPYYPRGVVEISTLVPGAGLRFRYTGFEPPERLWDCTEAATSVTCNPPPPPAGAYNVCSTVTVQVAAGGSVGVGGSSACAYGRAARATATAAPMASNAHAAAPHAAFGWTCEASPHQLATLWSVQCTVAP